MSLPSNKKLSILYILEVLKEYSDINHLLTQEEIINKIYSSYGLELERKSISSNIDSLIDFGYDIVKTKNGCYLNNREFENSEIQFLIDAVFSSKSISSKHSQELANKLSRILSKHDRKQYDYIYKADSINRSNNKQLFYTIDVLNEAIKEGKQVELVYNRFYLNDNKKANTPRVINPYFLTNNQGVYYLVCNHDYYDDIANYKVHKIENIRILDSDVKPITKLKGCEDGVDIAKYANDNVYMFSNEVVSAVIKIDKEYIVDYVVDWFGKNAKVYIRDNEIYADITANEQALIYWCLQYGENVSLVEPLSTRNKIKEAVSKMNDKYKE